MSSNKLLLGVNIDHCATVRQARYRETSEDLTSIIEPNPVELAKACVEAGAHSITVHLREDRRHIVDQDVVKLREAIKVPLNLEMAVAEAMVENALAVKPDYVCIVPESREEVTTEGGLDVLGQLERIRSVVKRLTDADIVVSLFIDPDEAQIRASSNVGASVVELHTGAYANAYPTNQRAEEFERLRKGCELAHELGITVNAGHGINYVNIEEVKTLPHLHELNIGHSIISRSLFKGVHEAVTEMKRLMDV